LAQGAPGGVWESQIVSFTALVKSGVDEIVTLDATVVDEPHELQYVDATKYAKALGCCVISPGEGITSDEDYIDFNAEEGINDSDTEASMPPVGVSPSTSRRISVSISPVGRSGSGGPSEEVLVAADEGHEATVTGDEATVAGDEATVAGEGDNAEIVENLTKTDFVSCSCCGCWMLINATEAQAAENDALWRCSCLGPGIECGHQNAYYDTVLNFPHTAMKKIMQLTEEKLMAEVSKRGIDIHPHARKSDLAKALVEACPGYDVFGSPGVHHKVSPNPDLSPNPRGNNH